MLIKLGRQYNCNLIKCATKRQTVTLKCQQGSISQIPIVRVNVEKLLWMGKRLLSVHIAIKKVKNEDKRILIFHYIYKTKIIYNINKFRIIYCIYLIYKY